MKEYCIFINANEMDELADFVCRDLEDIFDYCIDKKMSAREARDLLAAIVKIEEEYKREGQKNDV